MPQHKTSCRAYSNYQPPYEECTCGAELESIPCFPVWNEANEPPKPPPEPKPFCPSCGSEDLAKIKGCVRCLKCGWTKTMRMIIKMTTMRMTRLPYRGRLTD